MKISCAYAELKDPIHLIPHPKNPNKHDKDQIDLLARLISFYGFRHPIIVSKQSGFIVAGHGRLDAAKKLGLKEVPVDYQDFENDAQEYGFLVADNAIAGWSELDLSRINTDVSDLGPDFDVDMLGIKDFELEPADKFHGDEDAVPEPPKEPISKLGDLYELGNHRVLCGDSTSIDAVDKLMGGQKADMVFTDPPYGVSEETRRKDKNRLGAAASQNFSEVIGDESEDTAKDAFQVAHTLGCSVVYWGANNYSFLTPSRGWIVWDKRENKGTDDNGDAELAWTNFDKPIRIFYHLWKGMIKSSEHGDKRVHPTQKPIALAEWCFENYGKPSSVLDLFLGSGSTLIACEKTNRKCFGMELDPLYIDVIVSRWCKFVGTTKIKRNGEEMQWLAPENK